VALVCNAIDHKTFITCTAIIIIYQEAIWLACNVHDTSGPGECHWS